jgi:hypothetical protein
MHAFCLKAAVLASTLAAASLHSENYGIDLCSFLLSDVGRMGGPFTSILYGGSGRWATFCQPLAGAERSLFFFGGARVSEYALDGARE